MLRELISSTSTSFCILGRVADDKGRDRLVLRSWLRPLNYDSVRAYAPPVLAPGAALLKLASAVRSSSNDSKTVSSFVIISSS